MTQHVASEIGGGVHNAACGPDENATEVTYVNLIEKHLKAQDFESASIAALKGMNQFPSSKLIQSKNAAISQQRKDWPAAVNKLLQLLAMEGENRSADTYSRLVQAYRNAKQISQADAIALEALAAFPDNALIQSEYAWNAQVQQNWPAAVSRLEKLLALQGTRANEKTYVRLAQAYKNLEQPEKADAMLAAGLAKYPEGIQIKNESAMRAARKPESDLSNCTVLKERSAPLDVRPTLLLTTFPGHKSKNVGDNLISHSAIKMLTARNPAFNPTIVFRAENLDHYADGTIRNIVAPGFSVTDGVYPELFGLYSNLERLPNFFPIGCSFQHTIPSRQTFEEYQYSDATLAFLRFITSRAGALPCRDQLIVELLLRHQIPAVYSGDLAMYDESKLDSPFSPPKDITSVVFTIQHHDRYHAQSLHLLDLIKSRFPDARRYVAFHSQAGPRPQKIADYAVSLGFVELHLYGDVNNLAVYDDIDLHIGYRLHGHISFLRRRKPSILMVEDARSYGLAHTPGTDVGCFEALSLATMEADPTAPLKAMEFVDGQIDQGFRDYQRVFSFVDKTYREFVKPYFDNLAGKTL